MARKLVLVRRVTAEEGGWAGDGADWSLDSPPPDDAIMAVHPYVQNNKDLPTHGVSGVVRVTGEDDTREFTLQLFIESVLLDPAEGPLSYWKTLSDTEPATVAKDTDFTTDPADLGDSRVAFHLVPDGGSLAAGSIVEIWATEI